MTQRMGAQRTYDAAPSECHVKSLNVFGLSCHPFHHILYGDTNPNLWNTIHQLHDLYARLRIFKQHVVLRTSFPEFDLFRSLRPVQPLGSNGKAWPELKAFFLGGGLRVSF